MAPSLRDLPQLQELVQHPVVLKALARVNQSTVAQQATGFLNELRAGAARAVGSAPTSVGDLAEAFVRRVLGPHDSDAPQVNATGVVLGGIWGPVPLAEPAVHRVMLTASDYVAEGDGLLERVEHEAAKLAGAESALVLSSFGAIGALAPDWDGVALQDSRLAGMVDPADMGLASVPTVGARLAAGGEVVAVDGGGLLGGPSCGVVFGKRSALQPLRESPVYSVVKPGLMTLEALGATLELYGAEQDPLEGVPVLRLLSTPVENLRQRAERLAPLVAEAECVTAAEAVQVVSPWCMTPGLHLESPSWVIQAEVGPLGAESLVRRLRSGSCVAAQESEGRVLLDLRSVFPRWDQRLVAAVDAAVA